MQPDIQEALGLGISMFAGEAEEQIDEVLRDAARGTLKPIYNYHQGPARHPVAAPPFLPHAFVKRTVGNVTDLRCRPRLPVPMLVLHHHQRAGTEIALPLA